MTAKKDEAPDGNVYTALAAAQSDMGKVTKGAVNPHFKKSYADLADVMSVVRPALTANGLCLFHTMPERDVMRTVIAHGTSKTHIECDVPLIVQKNDMQGFKSATTYAKRIGVESLTAVAPEDDDGNAAADAAPSGKEPPRTVTPEQFVQLRDKAEEADVSQAKICEAFNAPSFEQFPADAFPHAMKKLAATIKAKTPEPDPMGGDAIPDFGE